MSAQQQGAKAGERVDNYSDKVKNTSWKEVGAKGGRKVDDLRNGINDTLRDSQGKTPEDHFRDLYGASASLVGNTYNYAWSWVPFTQRKAQEAKAKAQREDFGKLQEDARNKGIELKDDAMHTELPGPTDQTLGGLIDESRALIGKYLDTAIYYIKVSEDKAAGVTDNAKKQVDGASSSARRQGDSLVDQARNLAAFFLQKADDIVTYGQQKAGQAADSARSGKEDAKAGFENLYDNARGEAALGKGQGAQGDRPGFTVSANL